MKKFLTLFIYTISFCEDTNSIYKKALDLENQGNYKEAMILYKKIASTNVPKEDTYTIDLSKNDERKIESFSDIKKDFYEKKIEKVNDKDTDNSIKQILTKDFEIYPYKKNYMLPATYNLRESDNSKQFETIFQISFEKPISYNFFNLDESISVAYTQKSFWETSANSAPFRESNYEPELFIQIPYKEDSALKSYKVALNHQSNGKDGELSRSWNRVYVEGTFQFSNIFLIPKVWYRIPEKSDDNNPDIRNYYGTGDLTLLYAYKKHTFELIVRNNLELNEKNKGSAELNWTFPLSDYLSKNNFYGMFQLFSGYGTSLIDYDREVHKVGIGVAFSR